METSVNERIKFLINDLENGVSSRFAKKIGVSSSVVANYLPGGERQGEPSLSVLRKIASNYEKVNIEWLVTGEGEPFRKNTQLTRQNTIPDKEFVTGKEKRHENQLIPLYNLMAAAGLVTLFNSDQYILDYISIPNLPRCDGAVYVAGDSMYPLLKAGDIVIFRKVTNIEEGIRFGEMHVVEFLLDEDYTTTVKFVQKSDLGPEFIKLVSENRHHPPREVRINKVRAIAVVKASIRINAMV